MTPAEAGLGSGAGWRDVVGVAGAMRELALSRVASLPSQTERDRRAKGAGRETSRR